METGDGKNGTTPIVSIVGRKNSGKTTLIEKIIPEIKRRGYRLAVIKHDAHRFEIDHEGKDSYRHFHAGADAVIVQSASKMAMVRRLEAQPPLPEMARSLLEDVDLILTEGYKTQSCPKIEVFRPSLHTDPLHGEDGNWLAVVTDGDLETDLPRFEPDETARIVDFLEQRFLRASMTGAMHG
jgi:molybdopterin-guanine dinucleotide biosynthesis protein B